MMKPLSVDVLSKILPVGAAGIAAAIAVTNFLPKLAELVNQKVPQSIKRDGALQSHIERAESAGGLFQAAIGSFCASMISILFCIALSEIDMGIPQSLIAAGSLVGPCLLIFGVLVFAVAVILWTRYYLFLLKR
jgi:hypothetical protein